MKCDVIAEGIIKSLDKHRSNKIPIIARLKGTLDSII